jgi:hypothetical protein
MSNLTVDDQDLLARIEKKPELRSVFFRKISAPKWFDVLVEKGYFNPENIPSPTEADEKGYVRIPVWEALEYLVRLSPKLVQENDKNRIGKIIEILVDSTEYAEKKEISNLT